MCDGREDEEGGDALKKGHRATVNPQMKSFVLAFYSRKRVENKRLVIPYGANVIRRPVLYMYCTYVACDLPETLTVSREF